MSLSTERKEPEKEQAEERIGEELGQGSQSRCSISERTQIIK